MYYSFFMGISTSSYSEGLVEIWPVLVICNQLLKQGNTYIIEDQT